MLTEEAHHMFVGETGVGRVIQRTIDLMKSAPEGDVRAAGGIPMLFGGVFWRTVNITGTIYLANEARVRLGPLMFPGRY